jgi:5-methylcytosine-specific restriction endonuclease McrA
MRWTKEKYQKYLKSPHWIYLRRKLYKIFHSCQLCHTTQGPFNIHHLTYCRIGKERNTDLIVLCEDCHVNKVHKGLIEKKKLMQIVRSFWGIYKPSPKKKANGHKKNHHKKHKFIQQKKIRQKYGMFTWKAREVGLI